MIIKHLTRVLGILLYSLMLAIPAIGQHSSKIDTKEYQFLGDSLDAYLEGRATVFGSVAVDKMNIVNGTTLEIHFTRPLLEYPLRNEHVTRIYTLVDSLLSPDFDGYKLKIYAQKTLLEDLASPYYSDDTKRSDANSGSWASLKENDMTKPWVVNLSTKNNPQKALQGDHIALWQSHGWYYDQKLQRWEWQRARIFQTVEDLYTQSYVLPFLVPMLENAGANVMMPRERDTRREEVIVDNGDDNCVVNGKWSEAEKKGFANPQESYLNGENPFLMGTAIATKMSGASKKVSWIPSVPVSGEYAVYVSYVTLENSTDAALYTVKHQGGESQYCVNQQIGGSTWVYLGTFPFAKGDKNQGVYLSSTGKYDKESSKHLVVADAVKFGGGVGNIARAPYDGELAGNEKSSSKAAQTPFTARKDLSKDNGVFIPKPEVSGAPRYVEGARYWLQWAGFDESVYSTNEFANDYNDDYMSRGLWVNALSGGSFVNPDQEGYGVPIDLAFAFHSDAGTTLSDAMIGTLAIYTRYSEDKDEFPTGEKRIVSRELADMIQTQIVSDVKAKYEEKWPRRGLWDRSYSESRTPEVPTMLLELLSHQNFADMRYGLDPSFRFDVSRAIYKGMLRFMAQREGKEVVIQPLPVNSVSVTLEEGMYPKATISWLPTNDPLEVSAVPTKYIVYKAVRSSVDQENRMNEYEFAGFDNGVVVEGTSVTLPVEAGEITSFKVTALNEGGESFPSEILSVGLVNKWKDASTVMVMNGFDRVSAPASFASPDSTTAGFDNSLDSGVPYINDYSFIGRQHEFRRHIPWMDDDAPGFGASYGNFENTVVAGNTFDYPYVHGKAILKTGYNFVSSSRDAVTAGKVNLEDYPIVDMIMGKQVSTLIGRKGSSDIRYEVFPIKLQKAITDYCNAGGNLLISGSYIATDLWDSIYEKDPETSINSNVYAVSSNLNSTTSELNTTIEELNKKFDKVAQDNKDLGFEYYVSDTSKVAELSGQLELAKSYIDSISVLLNNSTSQIAEYEKATSKDVLGKNFAMNVLKFKWMTHYASATGVVKSVQNPFGISNDNYSFYNYQNSISYSVDNPDAFVPVGPNAYTIFRYADNNISAGVAYKGEDYSCVTLGFPIESLKTQEEIDDIIANIFRFWK